MTINATQRASKKQIPAKHQPTDYQLFTGGKLPELAIGFNLAFDNIEKYIKTLQDIDKPLKNIASISDKTLSYLRHYLWKGNSENKNTAGYELSIDDREIIIDLLQKLDALRNFHSHFWHQNSCVSFGKRLREFIENRHNWACGRLLEEKNADASLYYNQFEKYPLFKNNNITQNGRFFLLSFFLNKGEMQSIMQLRQGYKRNDMPEYRFKHKVYTFYCHREGAAWDSTGVSNVHLGNFDNEEQKRILSGRNAYRIFNYLNDIPDIQQQALPLILESGEYVENMDQLLQFVSDNELLPNCIFHELEEHPHNESAAMDTAQNEIKKRSEQTKRDGHRRFNMAGVDAYEFEISYHSLRHIITDIYLDIHGHETTNESLQHFEGVLRDCAATRRYIYDKLNALGANPIHADYLFIEKKYSSVYIDYSLHTGSMQEMYYTPNEWRNIPISPTPKVEKLLIEWHSVITMGTPGRPQSQEIAKRKKLLNYIRPATERFDTSPYTGTMRNGSRKKQPADQQPEPLMFHLSYYYKEQTTKKRKEDYFLEWAAHFLINKELVPDWSFEMEQLSYEKKAFSPETPHKLKKVVTWSKYILENMRLRIIENHLNVGIEHNGKTYTLRIGEKTMKYLLAWYFMQQASDNRSINEFLKIITLDLHTLGSQTDEIDCSKLALLEPFALPSLFYKTCQSPSVEPLKATTTYKQQVAKYLEAKQNWIGSKLKSKLQLNRNQKNEIILQTYKLFDFSTTKDGKFLRKNEYEQMSVCHYLLYQQKHKINPLLRSFELDKRLPHDIRKLLNEVIETPNATMDDLFDLVLVSRHEALRNVLDLVNSDGIKNKKIAELVRHLNIHINDSNLSSEDIENRNTLRTQSLNHIPFSVHPALALKYCYPEEFAAQTFAGGNGSKRHVFLRLRQDKRRFNMLPTANLRQKEVIAILAAYKMKFTNDKELKKYENKWKQQADDIMTKDILLLHVAERYLHDYDQLLAAEFRNLQKLKKIKLYSWFSDEIPIKLLIPQDLKKEIPANSDLPKEIFLLLRMHQLDDFFFRTQKDMIMRLSIFFINWRNEEIAAYKGNDKIVSAIIQWPDGRENSPLTVGHLIEARRINAHHARELTQYIFDYEQRMLQVATGGANDVEKQLLLIARADRDDKVYLDFTQIQELDQTTTDCVKEMISKLRNKCLHSVMPLNASLRQQALPGSVVADALQIYNRLGKDRAAPNKYEQDEKNDAPASFAIEYPVKNAEADS